MTRGQDQWPGSHGELDEINVHIASIPYSDTTHLWSLIQLHTDDYWCVIFKMFSCQISIIQINSNHSSWVPCKCRLITVGRESESRQDKTTIVPLETWWVMPGKHTLPGRIFLLADTPQFIHPMLIQIRLFPVNNFIIANNTLVRFLKSDGSIKFTSQMHVYLKNVTLKRLCHYVSLYAPDPFFWSIS